MNMPTGKYEFVVIWENGDKDVYSGYYTAEEAEEKAEGMKTALGDQISWYCVRPQMH